MRLLLGLAVFAANLFVIALVGYSLYEGRHQQITRTEIQTQNLAAMLQQGLSSRIRSIDLTLMGVVNEHHRQTAKGPIQADSFNEYLYQRLGRLPELEGLRTTNAQGEIVYGYGVNPAARVSLADRDYFVYQRNNSEGGVFLGNPVKSRVSGNMIVALSRRLETPDGAFDGIVYATIRLDELTRIFSSLDLGEGGTVVLRDTSLRLVARFPQIEGEAGATGNTKTSAQFRDYIQSGTAAGTYYARNPSDGTPRIYSFQRLPQLPWVVVVGLAESTFLNEWHNQTQRYSGFALFFLFASMLVARALWSSWQRQTAATQALESAQATLQTVTDLASDWVYWRSPDGKAFHYLSPTSQAVTGYDEAALKADPGLLDAMIHPDDQAHWRQHLQDQEGHASVKYRILTPDGSTRWVSHSCKPVFGPSGEYLGRRGAFLDISETVRAEEELHRSQDRLATIFRASPAGMCISSVHDGRFIEVNDAFVDLYGHTRQALIGQTSLALGFWISLAERNALIEKIAATGSARNEEIQQRRADGQILNILASGEILEVGGERFLLSIHVDISQRKRDEEALRQAKEDADAANRAKSQFLAVMSHELRTPMNGILGMAQLLQAPQVDDHDRREYARTLYKSGQSLQDLLNDILDHSKIEAGRMDLVRVGYQPLQLLTETVALFQGTALQKRLSLSCSAGTPEQARYWGDPQRLRQVLSNLVNNALKFTEKGSVTLSVEPQADEQGQSWLLYTVADTGIGIAPEKHSALFQSFSQVDDSFSRRYEGTGLGLSITRNLVKLMGGEVGLDSALGQGSTFWFRIPAEAADNAAPSAAPALRTGQAPALDREALSQDFVTDAETIGAAIGTFLTTIPDLERALRAALEQGNLGNARELAAQILEQASRVHGLATALAAQAVVDAGHLGAAQSRIPRLLQALKELQQTLYEVSLG